MSQQPNTSSSPDPRPEPGTDQPAPDFSGKTTEGDTLGLADLCGTAFVLYFYPRDSTPGCTTEAREFQAALPAFEAAGARIVGVSNDDATSHRKFCEKQGIEFPLIADTDRSVSRSFNVLRMKNMFGKRFEGIERSTFLVDADGVIRQAWRKVKVPGHVEAVLQAVKAL
ncbi:MAG: peroxiredoxin [Guyparkeria sp.]